MKEKHYNVNPVSILKRCVWLIFENYGKEIDLRDIPIDDPDVFNLFSSGDTSDITRLDGKFIRGYLKILKPENIEDITVLLALYLPGPMILDDFFIRRLGKPFCDIGDMKGVVCHKGFIFAPSVEQDVWNLIKKGDAPEAIQILKKILGSTYGLMVYREQVIQVLQNIGGFTKRQACKFIKDLDNQKIDIIKETGTKFVENAKKKGLKIKIAKIIYKQIAKYGIYTPVKSKVVDD